MSNNNETNPNVSVMQLSSDDESEFLSDWVEWSLALISDAFRQAVWAFPSGAFWVLLSVSWLAVSFIECWVISKSASGFCKESPGPSSDLDAINSLGDSADFWHLRTVVLTCDLACFVSKSYKKHDFALGVVSKNAYCVDVITTQPVLIQIFLTHFNAKGSVAI